MISIKFGVNRVINIIIILKLGILGMLISLLSTAKRSLIVIELFEHYCMSVKEFY